jgi:pyruvate,water dikinase
LKYFYSIDHLPSNLSFGNKALGLKKLVHQQFSVPHSWAIPAEAKGWYEKNPEAVKAAMLSELKQVTDSSYCYAVRSSGELEDSTHYSYAGQFVTELNVQGEEALLEAIGKVWDSEAILKDDPYSNEAAHPGSGYRMGVIVQEMIQFQWSGVAFSINPVTGRNETVIEGVRGGGAKLVQEGITPQRWIHHQGTWEPIDETESPPRAVLELLVSGMQKLRKIFKGEIDVEWGWDGKQLWYLQCRSVTTSRYPTIYANHISREVLPGMIKPLVWSINNPVVNSAWIRLLSGLLGNLPIQPEQLSRPFYYRAYFNMGTLGALFQMMGLPRDSLESLMGRKDPSGKSSFRPSLRTMRYLPSMLFFLLSNMNLGRKFRRKIIHLNRATDQLQEELAAMPPDAYTGMFRKVSALAGEAAYWNIIVPLTMQITHRLLQKKMKKRGLDISALEFTADFPELLAYDPQTHLEALRHQWNRLPESRRKEISSFGDLTLLKEGHPMKKIQKGLERIILEFGHFSESGNDFSYQPWRENPDFLFDLIRDNPGNDKEQTPGPAKPQKIKNLPKRTYRRAGQYRLYREMISSTYTRAYGLFRILFLNTGNHFTRQGYLLTPEDVFYLTLDEHDRLISGEGSGDIKNLQRKIDRVKQEMDAYRDISLPSVIYGETPPPVVTQDETMLKGIPVSPGLFEGEVVVVKGYQDFKKNVEGRILVIPFSDVGWTPILSRAGAIVAESGGLLSHASIIARELAIPAISSVDNACTLKDGTKAAIDGFHGVMTLSK